MIHVISDNYEKSEEVSICKWRSQKGKERNVTSLNGTLPKSSDWENFLNNDSNKKRLTYCYVSTYFYRTQSKKLCLEQKENNFFKNQDRVLLKLKRCKVNKRS